MVRLHGTIAELDSGTRSVYGGRRAEHAPRSSTQNDTSVTGGERHRTAHLEALRQASRWSRRTHFRSSPAEHPTRRSGRVFEVATTVNGERRSGRSGPAVGPPHAKGRATGAITALP